MTALIAAAPALLLAVSAWLQADAKAREAERAKTETARAYESYGEYTTDQLRRDEALLRALRECERDCGRTWQDLAVEGPVAAYRVPDAELGAPKPEPQAQAVLDEIARSEGWKPEGGPR